MDSHFDAGLSPPELRTWAKPQTQLVGAGCLWEDPEDFLDEISPGPMDETGAARDILDRFGGWSDVEESLSFRASVDEHLRRTGARYLNAPH